jgi:hypothetical protein
MQCLRTRSYSSHPHSSKAYGQTRTESWARSAPTNSASRVATFHPEI